MGPKALQFIHAVARKLATPRGKGITTIANRMDAEAKAGEIAAIFQEAGLPINRLDEFIKSEKDVLKYLNIIESSKPIAKEVSKKKGEVFDLIGKKIDTSKPILGGKNVELTHNEKIDWLVKNVSPTAEQTIPPKATLEAMLKDGREDLIDHFFEMHTKELGKPKINIDTSDLKHPELVKKMMMDEKLKPTLVKTEAQIKTKLEGMNKQTVERIKRKRYEAAQKAEREKMAKDSEPIDLSKYDDAALNALVAEDKKLLAEANKLSGAGVNYGRVREIEVRRKEIKEILEAAQDVPPSGYDNFKADLAAKKQTEAQIKTKLEKQNKEAIERLKKKREKEIIDDMKAFEDPEDLAYGGIAGMLGEPTYADGGRVPLGGGKFVLDAARRKFLQMVGAGAAGVTAAKTGLFGLLKGSKPAAGVAEATSAIVRDTDGIPNYVYDLIKVVQNKGKKEIIPGFKGSDLGTKHSYKGVEVTEEAGGNIRIKKEVEGGGQYTTESGDVDTWDGVVKELDIEINKGGTFVKDEGLETAKIVKEPDDIIEATVRPDMDGKMKDVDFFIDDADHLDLKKIADEVIIKKASGGRVPYFEGDIVDPEGYNISKRELGILANADPSMREMLRKFLTRIRDHEFIYPDRILDISRGRRTGEASGGRVPLGGGGIGDTEIAADIDKSLNQLMEDFKLYKDYGGRGNLKDYINKYRALRFLHKEGGRVPLGHGGKGTPRKLNMKNYFKLLDADGDMDIDEWLDILNSLPAYRGYQTGGRVPMFAGLLAKGGQKLGKFTKSEVLIKMLEKTLKGSKDPWTKTNLPNFIKELKAKPELANDPQVWNYFTGKLPKNQRLVVHSDDTVDFWTQSDFGPHNIEMTNKFMKTHPNLSRDEAVRIQNMEPEDQILEMKRLETIADRSRTKNASGGRVSLSAGGLAGMLGE